MNTTSLQRHNQELSILNSIAQALNREIDLEQTLRVVLAQVVELFDLRTAWIFLAQEEGDDLYLAAAHNLPSGFAEKPLRMTGSCYCLDVYREGDLAEAANISIITCTRLSRLLSGTDNLRFHATIPLYTQEEKLGVLNVASPDWQELSEEDLQLLYTVGDMLSIAIARNRLFAKSAQLGALEERNRLAREIHDTLAQGLSAITLQLETADVLLETAAAQADSHTTGPSPTLTRVHTAIQQALTLSRNSLDDARRSVMDLRAAPLDGCSLSEALAGLLAAGADDDSMACHFESQGDDGLLPAHVEVSLFRIAQEALTNVGRHAKATEVRLLLVVTPERVTLTIQDDGVGFDLQQIEENRFGLVGLRERVQLLGGELCLESAAEVGTEIVVVVPLSLSSE